MCVAVDMILKLPPRYVNDWIYSRNAPILKFEFHQEQRGRSDCLSRSHDVK